MKPGLTDITLLLDRSGSMELIKDDTIGGIRSFIELQKAIPGECRFSFIQFDKPENDLSYEVMYSDIPIQEVNKIELNPRGWTPLLDAVGRMINETGQRLSQKPEEERPEHVIVVIATDGQENSSKEFKKDQIKQMIEHQQSNYEWHFAYIGANQDAFQEADGMGIPTIAVLGYAATAAGTQAAYRATSDAVGNLRSNLTSSLSYSDSDRAYQKKQGYKH